MAAEVAMIDEKRSERVVARVTPSVLALVAMAASRNDLTISSWAYRAVRHELDRGKDIKAPSTTEVIGDMDAEFLCKIDAIIQQRIETLLARIEAVEQRLRDAIDRRSP